MAECECSKAERQRQGKDGHRDGQAWKPIAVGTERSRLIVENRGWVQECQGIAVE